MKKYSQLFIVLVLSIGTINALSIDAMINLTKKIPGQKLPSLAPMLEKVLPTVVTVHVERTNKTHHITDLPAPLKRFFGQFPNQNQTKSFEGLGSGVIIDAVKGYILTNNHVVNSATKMSVQLSNGKEYSAKLIGCDQQTDIALIQVLHGKNLAQIQMADSDLLKVGDFAVAIGNPFGLGQTATSGIISALGRSGFNLEGLENFIQTDAAINRGNSGGALVNLEGQLIGVNTAILASSGGNIGIGFAIPSNMALNLVKQLIKFGEIHRAQLGIKCSEMNAEIARAFNVNIQNGVFIYEVLPKSSADKSGIKTGDIITSFNKKPVSNFSELRVNIATTCPGHNIQIGLLHGSKSYVITVTLLEQTKNTHSGKILYTDTALQEAQLGDGTSMMMGNFGTKVIYIKEHTPVEHIKL